MTDSRKGILFVCATPIGNMEDITLRALNMLKKAEILICEDSRRTKKLLYYYGVRPSKIIVYHLHSKPKRKEEILDLLEQGKDLFMVSDAGMPGIADPGAELISQAREKGVKVTVLPGACAVSSALALSGLPADRFIFLGFLDRLGKKERLRLLKEKSGRETLVMFEFPHKI